MMSKEAGFQWTRPVDVRGNFPSWPDEGRIEIQYVIGVRVARMVAAPVPAPVPTSDSNSMCPKGGEEGMV